MAHKYYNIEVAGDKIFIFGDDAVHLARVMRKKAGDELLLCDGKNIDYKVVVSHILDNRIECGILSCQPSMAEASIAVALYVGYCKGDKLEWIIQKSVELGVVSVTPFFSAYTVVKPKKEEEKNKRYNKIATEAAKQCGRGILPKINMPLSYSNMLKEATQLDYALFLYEKGGKTLKEYAGEGKSYAIITGAEGGFSGHEAEQAKTAGCITIGLGKRILRCETAPIATLAALMAFSGNME